MLFKSVMIVEIFIYKFSKYLYVLYVPYTIIAMHSFFLVEATKSEVQSQYTKPKMSYAQLIAEALLTGSERMLTLNDIYIAINKQHPYYSLDAASGRNWQNAIRLVKLLENILSGFYQRLSYII